MGTFGHIELLSAAKNLFYFFNSNLAELILSPGPLLRVSPSSEVSPGMIDTVDDGSVKLLPSLLLPRGSGHRIQLVGE